MMKAVEVAKYFLKIQEPDDNITNMKLQKLLYYAQGFHLALYKKRLFKENLEAWPHGPVVPQIYHLYKDNCSNPISPDSSFDAAKILEKVQGLLDEIYNIFGAYSAAQLRKMTHEDKAWINGNAREDKSITDKDLVETFKDKIVEE